jgi:biopolymer transport protein ExbB
MLSPMPTSRSCVDCSKLLRFAFLWVLFCALAGPGLGQVPDRDLNSLERSAAINREASKPGVTSTKPGIDFFTLLVQGGVFMIPIGVVSIVVVTIVFDRMIGLRTGRLIPGKLRRTLVQLNRQGDLSPNELYQACGDSRSALANVMRNISLYAGRPLKDLQTVAQETAQIEADRAYSNVRWLNLAAGVAPLLGLLGTVWGLIRAFHDTTQLTAGQNRADFLAVGIYEALVTTLAGLMVAIPAAVASHYFEGRVTKIFGTISEIASGMLARLEHLEGKARFELIGRDLVARDIRVATVSGLAVPNAPMPPPVSVGPAHTNTAHASTARATHRADLSRSDARPTETDRAEKMAKNKPLG